MPRPEKKAKSKSGKHTPRPTRFPGRPYRVNQPKGFRDFLDAGCTVDDKNNLCVLRIHTDAEPTILIVYAAGAWDSFEELPAAHAEEPEGTSPDT